MRVIEIDTPVERTLKGEEVDLSIMEVLETPYGTFFAGFNHNNSSRFLLNIADDIPEIADATQPEARKNMTVETVTTIIENTDKERIEFHPNINSTQLIEDYVSQINKGNDSAGVAMTLAMMSQYGQISKDERYRAVERHTSDDILKKLAETYPEGPKSIEELKAEGSPRNQNPFMTNMGVIDTDRGTYTSPLVAQLDQ